MWQWRMKIEPVRLAKLKNLNRNTMNHHLSWTACNSLLSHMQTNKYIHHTAKYTHDVGCFFFLLPSIPVAVFRLYSTYIWKIRRPKNSNEKEWTFTYIYFMQTKPSTWNTKFEIHVVFSCSYSSSVFWLCHTSTYKRRSAALVKLYL